MLARMSVFGQLLLMVSSVTAAAFATLAQADETSTSGDSQLLLDAVPSGYALHAYDDCGIPERQPHVLM